MMKERITDLVCGIGGVGGGGIATTLLSINLKTIEGFIYFVLTSFIGGLVGYTAKKVADFFYQKITKTKTSTQNEGSD